MNTQVVIAAVRCAADYATQLCALAHSHARVLREYRARSCTYDKWLDEKAEEADTISKQLAAQYQPCVLLTVRMHHRTFTVMAT